ncbi:MAG: hypothetical protein VX589_10350 [Myxococcota bacterium]|nr:hypothetical protein [Myxococcota bacterium]
MRVLMTTVLSLIAFACTTKPLDPSKTLCDPGEDCGQGSPGSKVVPLTIRVDDRGLYLDKMQLAATDCIGEQSASCTEKNAALGRARLTLKNRQDGAFSRPIKALVVAVRERLNTQQSTARVGASQTLKMAAGAQFKLFSDILLSLEKAGVTTLKLGLIKADAGPDVPVMRPKQVEGSTSSERTINVALKIRNHGFTVRVHRAYRSRFPPDFFEPVDMDPDGRILARKLARIKAESPSSNQINVTAKNDVTMGNFVQALRTVVKVFNAPLVVKSLGPNVLRVLDTKMKEQLRNMRDIQPAQ